MHQKVVRPTLVAAGALAAVFIGAGAAVASPAAVPPGCHAFPYLGESATAQCTTDNPGTIQVVIECTNTSGVPYPVTIFGPVVRATAYNDSSAECDEGEELTNYFIRYLP
jgi:hypothetical protein